MAWFHSAQKRGRWPLMVPTYDGLTSNGMTLQHQTEIRPATWRFQQQSQQVVSFEAQI